jgi:hypothetical protein
MSNWFSTLFSGSATSTIDAIGNVGDKLFTSDEERGQLALQTEELKQKPQLYQAITNLVSASHRNWFVAGGRPALLWVAAMGLFLFFPVKMAVGTYIWAKLSLAANVLQPYPFTGDGLMELVGMLLGLATLRTVEKAKGLTK